ncbi:hypothetical protein SBOR_1278 [Sclerotinia borealis F-4128]|uniref:Uncharacterized protein n=1 Tax=Sclerotinia borealis (strain F-4128) TaxID=1432307 RepID=W9CUT1_SCLBF|nr:hypothetical protein SBOR_1278 [Sclerotinia borealis F-4128]
MIAINRRRPAPAQDTESLKLHTMKANMLEARKQIVQKRALAAKAEAADRNILRFLSSEIITEPERLVRGPAITIDMFPVELKLQILGDLTDIHSLHSLISTSQKFYDCYMIDRCNVLCSVLVNEMTLPIFIQAVVISSESVCGIKWKGEWKHRFQNVRDFMDQYSQEAKVTTLNPRDYNLKTLIRVAKFHSTIKATSKDYFESCLGLHPWTHEKYEKSPLERVEELRIQRALYNIELYFRLLKHGDGYMMKLKRLSIQRDISPGSMIQLGLHKSFLGHFTLWETEEMYSILDYMEREYHYILQDCKRFLVTSSQAQLYGSPSTLAKIRMEETRYRQKHPSNPTNRSSELECSLSSMGIGYFWKVCRQDGPKTMIPLLDKPIQRLAKSTLAFYKLLPICSYLQTESVANHPGLGTSTATHTEFKFIYTANLTANTDLHAYFNSMDSTKDVEQALKFPSSSMAWNAIDELLDTSPFAIRDFLSSFGYCMWTSCRLNRLMEERGSLDVMYPSTVSRYLGPRFRLGLEKGVSRKP